MVHRILTPLLIATAVVAAHAEDFSADLPKVQEFLELDKSYSPVERKAAEESFAKLKAASGTMSRAEFQLAVARIAAAAHNGHTMLLPGVWMFEFNRIPLRLHVFADGLYVVHAPPPFQNLLGAQVLAVDGRGARELRRAFADYFGAREGKRDEWAVFFLESPALLHAAGLAKADDRVTLRLKLADGGTITEALSASLDKPDAELFDWLDISRLVAHAPENTAKARAVPVYLQSERRAFHVATLADLDAVYMQMRINKDFYDQKISDFFDAARAALKESGARNAIVDMRLNGGGDLNTTRDFLEALPGLLPAGGRIFVLTSGRTFSAGIASIGYLKQAAPGRVTIVGEPIGDHLEFWAEGGFTELPASRAYLLAATERHNYSTGCPEADCHWSIREHPIRVRSLEPDLAAPLTYSDYRAGRDVALDAVRAAIGK